MHTDRHNCVVAIHRPYTEPKETNGEKHSRMIPRIYVPCTRSDSEERERGPCNDFYRL